MRVFSPSGPKGPRESSNASNRVAWAPIFRAARGPFLVGDRDDEDGESEGSADGFDLVSGQK